MRKTRFSVYSMVRVFRVDQGLMMKEGMPGYAGQEHWCYGGDFGDPIHDAQFCINGLMFPNRQPHPSLHEVKHVQSPIHIGIAPAAKGGSGEPQYTVSVTNRYDFMTLKHVVIQWRVMVGGAPLQLSPSKQLLAPEVCSCSRPCTVCRHTPRCSKHCLPTLVWR